MKKRRFIATVGGSYYDRCTHSSQKLMETKRSFPLLRVTAVLTVAILSLYFFRYSHALKQTSIPAEDVVGAPLPAFLHPSLSFKTDEGRLAQLFYPEKGLKLTIALVPTRSEVPRAGSLVDAMKGFKVEETPIAGVHPFLARVLTAQFDPLGARERTTSVISTAMGEIKVELLRGRKKEHYLIGVQDIPQGQIAVVAFRLGEHVDTESVAHALNALQVVKGSAMP
jgi:hypothetical protein